MSKTATFIVVKETSKPTGGGYVLYLQYGRFEYSDRPYQAGYRFIWKDPEGRYITARGQARLPSLALAEELMNQARAEGWGDRVHE